MSENKIKNVFGTFDGISCGQLALQKANIHYDNYYASEIKPVAIKVTQHNFPNTIQLGDIKSIKGSDFTDKIDLFIGGSVCKDLSSANKTRLGLQGIKSGLFYEYLRLYNELKPTYFLLENVKMPKTDEKEISNLLGVNPIIIDSKLYTGGLRKRLYWTNIQFDSKNIIDKNIKLQDILENGYTDRDKARCLLESDSRPLSTPLKMFHRYYGTGFSTLIFKDKHHYIDCKSHYDLNYKGNSASEIDKIKDSIDNKIYDGVRYLTSNERLQLQTIPKDYLSLLTNNEISGVLGDCWTVDVIADIFRGLK